MSKPVLVVVSGPTASGKTSLSIELAAHFSCPILSMDSRQIFKELSIGTAVPEPEELQQAKHFFIHSHSIADDYSAGNYEEEAVELLNELFEVHKVVIAVGGSTLYMKALLDGFDDFPTVSEEAKEQVSDWFEEGGLNLWLEKLKDLDPEYFDIVDRENPRRIQRALEVCVTSGKSYSSFRSEKSKERPFQSIVFAPEMDRENLYSRINLRVDQMMNRGLIDEARRVESFRHKKSLQTVGYRELFRYFDGEYDLDRAISEIKKNTRRYAKRQITWLRGDDRVNWVDFEKSERIIESIEKILDRQ
jgi:tRNA dimethylallyltransferase